MNIRIIPRLDIKGPNLVKGIHLEGLRVLGKPEAFAKFYYEAGADELIYQDVVASLYDRNSLQDIISRTAKEIFIPLTVGGGIRTLDDIKNVLRAGADKVSINTSAIKKPQFIRDAALKFGSSTIVVAIEAIKQQDGNYFAFIDNGREATGIEVVDWACRVEELGAGEIVITSVDREGTGIGFDVNLVKMIADKVTIPVIAHGGAGKKEDLLEVLKKGNASAVAIASILHYGILSKDFTDNSFNQEGNTDFLRSGKLVSTVEPTTIKKIKMYLYKNNIDVRMITTE